MNIEEGFSRPELYEALARLLEYPQDQELLLDSLARVGGHLENCGMEPSLADFEDFLRCSTLPLLQEEYVANFDFNAAKAPYLGHHLYGEGEKKAAFMIKVKQEFKKFGFTPEGCELPDHLTVLLYFLAHLSREGEEQPRREFIGAALLPGIGKLLSGGERSHSAWLPVIRTAEAMLKAECKEVAA